MRTTNRRLQQQYNLMRGERNRAIGERNRAKASVMWHEIGLYMPIIGFFLEFGHWDTIEPSSTSSQPSTKYDMAAVGIAAPIFHGREDEDLNLFIDNFLGYINTVGIDPLDDAGAPPVATANGGAGATRRAFRALAVPEVANGLHVGTYLPGSDADVYSRVAGNAWRRAGGRPTHQPVNGLGNHGGPFNAAVQNQPIIRFSNLYQEQGEPVRSYYKRVERAGILVKCSMDYKGARVLKRLKKEELAGYTHPVTPHEGAVIQRSTDVITQERLQELLKAQAEELTKNFQAQFKQLQASKPVRKPPVYRQQIKPVRPKPRPRVVQDHQDPDWDDGYVDHDFGDDPGDPDAPEWTSEMINMLLILLWDMRRLKDFQRDFRRLKIDAMIWN
ncbi:hypothetical protein GLOIN_2v1790588 [Rhizophagus irregularis DAOM 181602=DAOM 197198]|nr:hypothetical protein GLOIN_2v1790588 [Rhizophagus irregularis DAOM 181602=DAOM 197198]